MHTTTLAAEGDPPLVTATDFADDPHAKLKALREHHPLVQLGEGQYFALRAVDVIAMLTDPRTIQIEGSDYARLSGIPAGPTNRFLADFFLLSNDDAHRAKRKIFAKSFSMGRIRAQERHIRMVADAIVSELPRGEPFDFVEHMAARIPAEMIARLFGLPISDVPFFSQRIYTLARAFTPAYPDEEHEEIDHAAGELFAYVEYQLTRRYSVPEDDLLTATLHDWQGEPRIDFKSLVHQVMGMMVGGVDTTRAAFAMLVSLLLQHPQQWQAVLDDRSLAPGAVAEALRYEPSVGSIARMTVEPITIGDFLLPVGTMVRVSTMSAMRDPELYADPDQFDIFRKDHPRLHAVFGHGPHRCIGEMLARIEMEQALRALAVGAPDIELLEAPEIIGFGGIRRITPMMVRIP